MIPKLQLFQPIACVLYNNAIDLRNFIVDAAYCFIQLLCLLLAHYLLVNSLRYDEMEITDGTLAEYKYLLVRNLKSYSTLCVWCSLYMIECGSGINLYWLLLAYIL